MYRPFVIASLFATPLNKNAMATQMNIVQEEEKCLTFHYVRKEAEHTRVVLVWG